MYYALRFALFFDSQIYLFTRDLALIHALNALKWAMNLRENEVVGLACIRLLVKLKLTLEVSCNEQLKPQIVDWYDRHGAFPLLFIMVDVA